MEESLKINNRVPAIDAQSNSKKNKFVSNLVKDCWLYVMLLPGLMYFIVFKYAPMWGILISFQDYQPFLGILNSPWVGLTHFQRLFSDPDFFMLLRNTFIIAISNLVFFFPLPIIMALMLNEVRNVYFKRFVQTVTYMPHFLSWVVIVGISHILFTTEGGLVNELIYRFGGEKKQFLMSADMFLPMYLGQIIWKECGWGTILFLAALTGIDPQIYEAAHVDGANRFKQLWYITLPFLKSTIILLLILRLGTFLDTGFEQIFNMQNAMNRSVSEVFDTYVYRMGITQSQFSYSTAVGLFKSIIGLVLVLGSNTLARRFGEEGIF